MNLRGSPRLARGYAIAVLTVENFALAVGSMLGTAALIARLTPAAISASSIAVAADTPAPAPPHKKNSRRSPAGRMSLDAIVVADQKLR